MAIQNADAHVPESQIILRFAVAMAGLGVVGCFIAAGLLSIDGNAAGTQTSPVEIREGRANTEQRAGQG